MAKDKSKKQVRAALVTSAPDPPSPIRTSRPVLPKDQLANWEYRNLFPIVSIYDAIYLTIGIDPKDGDPEERENRAKFAELYELSKAHLSFGSLKLFPFGNNEVEVSEWKRWLSVIGKTAPEAWQPIQPKSASKSKKESDHIPRYREAFEASCEMRSSDNIDTPTSLVKHVIPYMQGEYARAKRFHNCCESRHFDDTENLARSIREGGKLLGKKNSNDKLDGNPLNNPEYLAIPDVPKITN